ncbi:MAG: DNA primase [Actinobacteria bacterium]|nr:DNA primase [Actinomycetota bacterium]
MGIHDEDIAKVRASADLVQLIGEHTEIKRSGRSWMARCPLHGERTPSLPVSPEKGVYYCFGCQRSGDAISFLQEIDNLDFVGAVESLAGRYGVTLRYTSQNEGATRARKRSLLDAVEKAVHFYHDRLLTSADAGEARGYLRSRGYDGELVRTYRIGWAPDDWDQLARRLKLKDDDLRDSGLGFVNKASRQQDSFRGRVMFPITDERGDAVGFGGRILPGHEGSKYKNTSTESSVYDKSKILYGLHTHRDGIVKAGEAIICEGYTDVIGYATGGIPRAVATCGTALTEDHVKLLKRFSADRVILSFDADAAGIAAAERVYAWEREYELDIRVAALPDGIDPDDLAREDPAALQRAVDEAMPFLKFRLERALAAGDLSTVEGRARTAEHALDVVAEHPDPLVRDPYVIEIADRCRLDVVRLRELLAGERSSVMPKRPRVDPDAPLTPPTRLTAEDEAIRLAIHRPSEVVGLLSAELFVDPVRREAYEALAEDGLVASADRAGPEAGTLLRRLAVDAGDADTDDVLAGLARLTGDRVMRDLQRSARMAEGTEQRRGYADAIQWVKSQLELVTESSTRETAVAQLLPWLIEHAEGREL